MIKVGVLANLSKKGLEELGWGVIGGMSSTSLTENEKEVYPIILPPLYQVIIPDLEKNKNGENK